MSRISDPFVVDSSVLIESLRHHGYDSLLGDERRQQWLSVVVVSELLAGATAAEAGVIVALYESYVRFGRVVAPGPEDWIHCGHVLAGVGRKFGYETIGRSRITNDALIALGASRLGLTLLTTNRKDFARLSEFIPFRWELI